MIKPTPQKLELLAPARDPEIAIEAIKHGADAVYIGAPSFGARRAASNTIADLAKIAEYAHRFNARVYATVNTILFDSELREAEKMIRDLYKVGIDALIVQDMAILRLDIPPIDLHASTQCDIRDKEKARFLADAGFSQIVLARELSLSETEAIHGAVPEVKLESFIHGALCVSYSGDCQASLMTTGRSANRGECAQICRLPYDLTDGDGRILMKGKHLLSLRDLNRSTHLRELIGAGVSSFKIEGRLKDSAYVKNTVAYYSRALDSIIESSNGAYIRQSAGTVRLNFTPDPEKSFNRGYTSYFTVGTPRNMACFETPKHTGNKVGKVTFSKAGTIKIDSATTINNGDGLVYFDETGRLNGFRVNRAERNAIFPAEKTAITPGTTLFRNRDAEWDRVMASNSSERFLTVDMTLRSAPGAIVLDATDNAGHRVSVAQQCGNLDDARTPQENTRETQLRRTGGTIYEVRDISDTVGNKFIPSSRLAALRRDAIEALDRASKATYAYNYRRKASEPFTISRTDLSYHDNISNSISRKFYIDHGAKTTEPALEAGRKGRDETKVMTTRYCLRRETGHCLRTPEGKAWKGPLHICSGKNKFRLDFDCKNCNMEVVWLAHEQNFK